MLIPEQFEMGHLLTVEPGPPCRVGLDDGREVEAVVPKCLLGLYDLVTAERVSVSFRPGKEPTLTGYLD